MEAECEGPKVKRARTEASEMNEVHKTTRAPSHDIILLGYGMHDYPECNQPYTPTSYALSRLIEMHDYTFANFWKTGTLTGTKIPWCIKACGEYNGKYQILRLGDVISNFYISGRNITKIRIFIGETEIWGIKYNHPASEVVVVPFNDGIIPIIYISWGEIFIYVDGENINEVQTEYGFLDTDDRRKMAIDGIMPYVYYNPIGKSWQRIVFRRNQPDVTCIPKPLFPTSAEYYHMRSEYRERTWLDTNN